MKRYKILIILLVCFNIVKFTAQDNVYAIIPPDPPLLESPENGSDVFSPPRPLFTWSWSEGADYFVFELGDEYFSDPYSIDVYDNELIFPVFLGVDIWYYWRVKACKFAEQECSSFTDPWRFRIYPMLCSKIEPQDLTGCYDASPQSSVDRPESTC